MNLYCEISECLFDVDLNLLTRGTHQTTNRATTIINDSTVHVLVHVHACHLVASKYSSNECAVLV